MKQTLLTIICCLLFAGVRAQASEPAPQEPRPQTKSAAGSAADSAGEQAAGPVLHLEETVWNFGDVPRKGGDVSHDFVFRNEGTAPLVVLRVITSCSCVKASFPKRPVAPGGEGVIRITYQPHKSEPGTFNKVIRILTNVSDDDILTVQGCSIEGGARTKAGNGRAGEKYE